MLVYQICQNIQQICVVFKTYIDLIQTARGSGGVEVCDVILGVQSSMTNGVEGIIFL